MADPTNGSFYSAEDSDSAPSRAIMQSEPESSGEYNKIEGGYYLWQSDDFARPLTRIENDIAAHYWNVQELAILIASLMSIITFRFKTPCTLPLNPERLV